MRSIVLALLLAALATDARADLTSRVDGSGDGAVFEGSVTLTAFRAEGDRVFATGTLSGALESEAGERVAEVEGQPVRLALDRGSLRASCDLLAARLGPTEAQAGGRAIRLEALELEIPARAGGAPLRERLCSLGEALPGGPAAAIAEHLDAVLRLLG